MTEVPSVLVTGSAGFLGRRLVSRLRALGRRVVELDLGSSDASARGDVRCLRTLRAKTEDGSPIYHLASVVGVSRVLRDPHATWSTAVRGTEFVCQIARERGSRLVVTSSSEVYGDGAVQRPMSEDDALPADYGSWPRASYPEGKRRAEAIVATWAARGVDARVARLFNVSGPGQRSSGGMVLPTIVEALLRGDSIPIVGDGSDVRCFQHVDDAVAGLLRLMELRRPPVELEEGGAPLLVNLGGGMRTSVHELARRAARLLGRSFEPRFVSSVERYGAAAQRCRARVPDTKRAEAWLGYRARRDLDRIILDLAQDLSSGAREIRPCVASPAARQL